MPPRRRHRSGYRPGQSSPELKAAITAEGEHLTRLEEPLVVIKAVGDTFAALDDALAEIALPRLKAIAALRRVATGGPTTRSRKRPACRRGRVAQLAREARARRL